jgi:hypothetical protein
MDAVTTSVRRATREWTRLGVLPTTRDDLAAELRADLEAAVADGGGIGDVTGPDLAGFARDWAYERGDVPVRARLLFTALSAGAGLVIGAALTVGFMSVVSFAAEFFRSSGQGFDFHDGGAPVLTAYIVTGVGGWLGAVLVSYTALRVCHDPFARRTSTRLAVTFAVGAVVAVGCCVGLAASLDFPLNDGFVVGEFLLATSIMAVATLVARRLAVGMPAILATQAFDAALEVDASM